MKDPDVALDLRPPPRTEPLLGLGSDLDDLFGLDPWLVIVGVLLLGVLVVSVRPEQIARWRRTWMR